jgi:predicted RecB family nuclease
LRLVGGSRIYSATDLTNFLACPHLTQLRLHRLEDRIPSPPARPASTVDLAVERGLEHESHYLELMRAEHGDELVNIETDASEEGLGAAVAATAAAMRAGAPMIYQAAFLNGPWMGYADFLTRIDEPSELGDWSYQPLDTKYARSVKPYFVIQLCSYAELIDEVQGGPPQQLDLILGDRSRHSLRFDEFHSYYRRLKAGFLAAMELRNGETYPLPVEHCEVCEWAQPCEERRIADDHLSQVANLGRAQTIKFEGEGIATVADLASTEPDRRPQGMSESSFERFRSQAALQVEERHNGDLSLVLLEPAVSGKEGPRGFGLLPEPSEGDLFFDIEGDPFYDEGLEYLWGISYLEDGALAFRAFWGLDHTEEKRALEEFVDFVYARRELYPDLHIYHYAPYERTALGRLMGRYATREEEIDDLFREKVLVDLYRVVTQSMQISRPSYSLKEVENFYDQGREAEVKQAGDSVLMFEKWRESGEADLLQAIEDYNREDCDSTLRLRDWLLTQREACEAEFDVQIPWRARGMPTEPDEEKSATLAETLALQETLLKGLPEDPLERSSEQGATWLLAQLLDYHRRAAKPAYWEYFDRLERPDSELLESDREALAGLVPVGDPEPLPPPARSSLQRFNFPAQEHKIGIGRFPDPHSCGIDPKTGESDQKPKSVEVTALDNSQGTVTLKLVNDRLVELPTALIPSGPYGTDAQREALRTFAHGVPAGGPGQMEEFTAGRDVLCRALPRTKAVPPGGRLQGERAELEQIKEVASGLEDSYLFVQGPPGSGKTYTGAQVIIDLIAAGRTVGVAASSHKAINNLLTEVEGHAEGSAAPIRGLKRSSGPEQEFHREGVDFEAALIGNSKKNVDFENQPDLNLIAGTAWLWCRERMRASVDYLVIDEAGQISLADAIAMSVAARNLILLGDPMQLAQISQGTHPPGSGASVLEHLLGEQGTIGPERGIFLEQTRRMHPDVCEFVSKAVYEDRLGWEPSCETQGLRSEGRLNGTGVRSIAVEHEGNTRESREEAEVIACEIEELLGAELTDRRGETSSLDQEGFMVVTPYNAQVRCLREKLDERGLGRVPIGTVDKFQGQEAAVVFFSMATSSGVEIPRNVEFLYSRNRLNVAVSRAQCMAVLVASPDLLRIECRTVEQMRLVNALCLLDSMGLAQETTSREAS